jgi:Xaa-Pro aminopeptidase
VLQVGRAIVFDYFPRLSENGYFHDMTRTWVLGRAPVAVQRAYDDVMGIFHKVMKSLKVGQPGSKYQEMTLDFFEERGHPTQRSHPGTMKGYVHSLGHGLGLNVHEAPGLSVYSKAKLAPGNVVTVEPGLYYPELGYGVRVEDTVYFDAKGKLHNLTDFPYDLVLPLKHKR